jgi:hypothetical protein
MCHNGMFQHHAERNKVHTIGHCVSDDPLTSMQEKVIHWTFLSFLAQEWKTASSRLCVLAAVTSNDLCFFLRTVLLFSLCVLSFLPVFGFVQVHSHGQNVHRQPCMFFNYSSSDTTVVAALVAINLMNVVSYRDGSYSMVHLVVNKNPLGTLSATE